jgi:hypothetical protein
MNYITMTEKGLTSLSSILSKSVNNSESYLYFWQDYIEDQWDNRLAGESLSVELVGLTDSQGYNIFFNPSPDDYTIKEPEYDVFSD